MVPSGMVTSRKPLPLMATSRLFLDSCRLPCTKLRLVATVRTPRPRCRPVGSWFCSVVVETLARLCEMTSSWVCWADMPVLAIQRVLIMVLPFGVAARGATSAVHAQQLAGGLVVGFGGLQQAHLLFELARCGNHPDHAFDRIHVRAFHCACQHAGVGVIGNRVAGRGAKQPVVAALERVFRGGSGQLEAANGLRGLARCLGSDRSIRAQRDFGARRDINGRAAIRQY